MSLKAFLYKTITTLILIIFFFNFMKLKPQTTYRQCYMP